MFPVLEPAEAHVEGVITFALVWLEINVGDGDATVESPATALTSLAIEAGRVALVAN